MKRLIYLIHRHLLRKELRINTGIERSLQRDLADARLAHKQIESKLLQLELTESRRQVGEIATRSAV